MAEEKIEEAKKETQEEKPEQKPAAKNTGKQKVTNLLKGKQKVGRYLLAAGEQVAIEKDLFDSPRVQRAIELKMLKKG